MRNDAPVTAFGLLGKPMQMIDGHGQFPQALGQRLAGFERHGAGDFVAAAFKFIGDFVQELAARLGRQRPPAREGRVSVLNRPLSAGALHGGHFGDDLSSGWVPDAEMLIRRHELAIEIERIEFHDVGPDSFLILIIIAIVIQNEGYYYNQD
jgi:hypothetical protein